MVFSSIVFLLYFLPLFLLTYYISPKKYKNIVLLLFSIFFYAWGAPKFIFVILGTTFIDFHLVKTMDETVNYLHKRLLFIASVSINLGLLIYFKYSNFFIENVNAVLSVFGTSPVHWTKILLPIGISFYTFETITYVADVYRKIHKPLDKFWDYQLYIILFPKLIAGPIVRFHEIADQITDRSMNDNIDNRLTGFYRFTIGLAKKVLLANQIGIYSDAVFAANYLDLDTSTAWIGLIAYAFQIYFDFSGYSDMAIGLGKMLGFKFPENFNNPYTAHSITEFWRRWHMTLNRWFVDYFFIPFTIRNRHWEKTVVPIALLLTFGLSGLWHGASWGFIVWGLYHGVLLILEKYFLLKWYKKTGKAVSISITFILVLIGFVFFKVENLSSAFLYLKRLFSFDFHASFFFNSEFYTFFFLSLFFSFFTLLPFGQKIQDAIYFKSYSNTLHVVMTVTAILALIFSVSFITSSEFNPFIYFRF
jgi:alginate O-acetyltransferase complex protein AlgI